MKYNDINKLKNEFSNKEAKNIQEIRPNFTKNYPYHETHFEHINTQTHPYTRTGVCAIFRNVRFANRKMSDEAIQQLLDNAIERYLQLAPLKKVDTADFINYVAKEYNVHIFSIESIDLLRTLSLEREIEPEQPEQRQPDNLIMLKNVIDKEANQNINKKRPMEMPEREIVEMPYDNIPAEMPMRTPNEMPTNRPVEMPEIKVQETKTRKHIPEVEIEMGM